MLCGWGVKAVWLISYVDKRGWQVKLCDPSLTRAIPEYLRDEYCAHYKELYKCPVYFARTQSLVVGWHNGLGVRLAIKMSDSWSVRVRLCND